MNPEEAKHKELVDRLMQIADAKVSVGEFGKPLRRATKVSRPAVTNAEFARDPSPVFAKACELAGVEITKRQASKWRRKTGRAYDFKDAAKAALSKEAHGVKAS